MVRAKADTHRLELSLEPAPLHEERVAGIGSCLDRLTKRGALRVVEHAFGDLFPHGNRPDAFDVDTDFARPAQRDERHVVGMRDVEPYRCGFGKQRFAVGPDVDSDLARRKVEQRTKQSPKSNARLGESRGERRARERAMPRQLRVIQDLESSGRKLPTNDGSRSQDESRRAIERIVELLARQLPGAVDHSCDIRHVTLPIGTSFWTFRGARWRSRSRVGQQRLESFFRDRSCLARRFLSGLEDDGRRNAANVEQHRCGL